MSKDNTKGAVGHANPPGLLYSADCGAPLAGLHLRPKRRAYRRAFQADDAHVVAYISAVEVGHQGNPQSSFVGWWRGLGIFKRVLLVLAVWPTIIGLSSCGASESPKVGDCVSFSEAEYRKNFGTKPTGQDLESLKVVCRRMVDDGMWK